MIYLEWNNIISEYFFNPANAGRDIHLYLTRTDIIHLQIQTGFMLERFFPNVYFHRKQ